MNWLDAAPFALRLTLGLAAGALTWWSSADFGDLCVAALRVRPFVSRPVSAALGFAVLGTIMAVLGLVHAIDAFAIVAVFGEIGRAHV